MNVKKKKKKQILGKKAKTAGSKSKSNIYSNWEPCPAIVQVDFFIFFWKSHIW
jgi:hypothetical protein